mgnify:CR=1 FL=1
MLQLQTEILAADSTGAKRLECIKVLGGSKRRYASIGDTIVIACLLYTSPSPRDGLLSRMPSSA